MQKFMTEGKLEPEPSPWEGRVLPMHPSEESRQLMHDAIIGTLDQYERETSFGMVASKVGETVARQAFEESEDGNVPYRQGDIILEISRMIGTSVRMAPNNELFVNHEYAEQQEQED